MNQINNDTKLSHDELMALIVDHYEHPRNYGEINGATLTQHGGNPGCGDVITVYVDLDKEGVIENAGFKGEGCMVSIAGTSLILENLIGKTLAEVEEMPPGILSSILGKRLVTTRHNCAYLGLNTLKKAALKWRKGKIIEASDRGDN